ncbi:hypothetical protein Tco_1546671 [Tanacetum coccineum]
MQSPYSFASARTLSLGMTHRSMPRSLLAHQGELEQVHYIPYPSRSEMPSTVPHPNHTSCSSESRWGFPILNSFDFTKVYMDAIIVNHMPKELYLLQPEFTHRELCDLVSLRFRTHEMPHLLLLLYLPKDSKSDVHSANFHSIIYPFPFDNLNFKVSFDFYV